MIFSKGLCHEMNNFLKALKIKSFITVLSVFALFWLASMKTLNNCTVTLYKLLEAPVAVFVNQDSDCTYPDTIEC